MSFVGLDNEYAGSGAPQALLERHGLMPADIVAAAQDVVAQLRQAEAA
jgi:transketolase C-terminal domain/subunit